MPLRRAPAALVLCLLLLPAAAALAPLRPLGQAPAQAPAQAPPHAPPHARATYEDVWIPGFDGTPLRATWFQPGTAGPWPLILRTHGWAGSRDKAPTGFVGKLLDDGYAVLTWDSRGFGESGGQVELDSPDYEVPDVSALLDWALANHAIATDGGKPMVGMTGASYAGGLQLLAGVFDPRITAVVPELAWSDLRYSLAPNGVLKTGWVLELYAAGLATSYFGDVTTGPPEPNTGGLDPELTQWLAEALATNGLPDDVAAALEDRSLEGHLGEVHRYPHVLLVQGWLDTLFTPNEALWNARLLRQQGADVALLVHGGGHGYPTPDGDAVDARELQFLDYWLQHTTAPELPLIETYRPWDGGWSEPSAFPDAAQGGAALVLGTGSSAGVGLPGGGTLAPGAPDGSGVVAVPATLAPAEFREVPYANADSPVPAFEVPGATAQFVAQAAGPDGSDVLGTPRLHLHLAAPAPDAALFAELLDVAPDGSTTVLGNQVTPYRLGLLDGATDLDLELTSVAHRFEPGHALALSLSLGDAAYSGSRLPAPLLVAADGSSVLTLPPALD